MKKPIARSIPLTARTSVGAIWWSTKLVRRSSAAAAVGAVVVASGAAAADMVAAGAAAVVAAAAAAIVEIGAVEVTAAIAATAGKPVCSIQLAAQILAGAAFDPP